MIQIRPMKKSDKQNLLDMLRKDGIDCEAVFNGDKSHYVVEDSDEIVGFSSYEVINNEQARLLNIYIRKQDRGFKLGDGLLRGVLNQLDRLKINKVFVTSTIETNGFFISEGLVVSNEIHAENEGELIFQIELPDFFKKPCKGSNHLS